MTSESVEADRWRPLKLDLLLAAAFMVLIQIEIWVFSDASLALSTRIVASNLTLLVALPLATRSTHPVPSFVVNVAGVMALTMLGYPSDLYQWTNLIMVFTLAERTSGTTAWSGLGLSLTGVALWVSQFVTDDRLLSFGFIAATWIAGWLAGRMLRSRLAQEALQADRDLAAELAAARQERLELQTQRTQMARELHDLVGHTVNVMVVHAGAGRRALPHDLGGARQALETIETTGRTALDELDRVLGILRSTDAEIPTTALPGLGTLPSLEQQFRTAGLATSILVTGDPSGVPASTGLAVYRIVQEALTNVLKHARATNAEAEVLIAGEMVTVEVTDDGRLDDEPIRPGRGLRGIEERAELHGGRARFERGDNGGLRVRCELSTSGAAL